MVCRCNGWNCIVCSLQRNMRRSCSAYSVTTIGDRGRWILWQLESVPNEAGLFVTDTWGAQPTDSDQIVTDHLNVEL